MLYVMMMMLLLLLLQASSEISGVFSFLRSARAGSDLQIVESLDAGIDVNACNPVSTEMPIAR